MNKNINQAGDRIAILQTFVRIAESGSLSAAAAQLGTSQPTISRRLQALEQMLGVKLIQRTTHTMKLTDDGERCYRHARRLIEDWQILEDEVGGGRDEPVGVPRIVVAAPGLLAGVSAIKEVDQLALLPWIALNSFYRNKVTLYNVVTGEPFAFDISPRLSTDSLYAVRKATLNGLGVAMVSSWVVKGDLEEGTLQHVLSDWRAAPLPVYLLYPYASYYPARLRKFIEMMKEVMPGLTGMRPPERRIK